MFEVQDLKYATLATVSRCGMVWFSEDVLSTDMIFNNFLARLRSIPLDEGEDEAQRRRKGKEDEGEEAASPMLQVGTASSGPRAVSPPPPVPHTLREPGTLWRFVLHPPLRKPRRCSCQS